MMAYTFDRKGVWFMSIKKLVLAILIALLIWHFGPLLLMLLVAVIVSLFGGG